MKIPVEKIQSAKLAETVLGVPIRSEEYWLRVSVHTRTNSLWAPPGHEIGWEQMPLVVSGPRGRPEIGGSQSSPLRKLEDGDTVQIAGTNFTATFSRSAGTLVSLVYDGHEMLAPATNGLAGPILQVWRAPTDNGKGFGNWLTLTDTNGAGLLVVAEGKTMAVSAIHFTAADLAGVRHNYELKPRPAVVLSLDAKQSGLGNSSCGPGVLERYAVLPSQTYRLRLRFQPCPASGAPVR